MSEYLLTIVIKTEETFEINNYKFEEYKDVLKYIRHKIDEECTDEIFTKYPKYFRKNKKDQIKIKYYLNEDEIYELFELIKKGNWFYKITNEDEIDYIS